MLYLMRHGADSPDRLGGRSEFGLTEKGIKQVHAAKEQLLDKGLEAIYSSDLERARQTAEIIGEYLKLPVILLSEFRETDNGVLAGMLKAEAQEKYPGVYWSALEWDQAYPGGESPKLFFERISRAWRCFKAENRDKTVLLVSHGGVMNVILCLEHGKRYTNKQTRYKIPDAKIISLE